MAQPQLQEIFEWLQRSAANRVEIYNVDTGQSIEKCFSYEDLIAGGNDPEEYFTRLLGKGVKTVQLQKKRKNGSSWIREGCGLNYGLSTEDNVAASGSPARQGATPQQSASSFSTGLMGSASFGLGFPEIMSMRSQADRYEETKSENRELKARVERLEGENRKLETECLTYKLGADSKPSAVDKIVEGLASNPAALASLIQSFKGVPGNPGLGLNAPVAPKLSDTKEMVIDTISNQHVSDEHVTAAYYVLVQAAQKNQPFMERYHKLLTEFNLIQHGSDSDSDSI